MSTSYPTTSLPSNSDQHMLRTTCKAAAVGELPQVVTHCTGQVGCLVVELQVASSVLPSINDSKTAAH